MHVVAVTWLLATTRVDPSKSKLSHLFFPLGWIHITYIMEDDELQAIRARRMAELQAQSGKSSVGSQHGLMGCVCAYIHCVCRVPALVLQDRLEWAVAVAMVPRTTKPKKSKSIVESGSRAPHVNAETHTHSLIACRQMEEMRRTMVWDDEGGVG